MYDNGYEFYKDLLQQYGKEQANIIAINYLDLQIHNTDPEELQFCKELYQVMKSNCGRG